MKKNILMVCLLLGLAAALGADSTVLLNAAGATFPYPMYSKWFDTYHQLHPNIQVNYQSIGSGWRHPPGFGWHSGLRSIRRPDDRRANR